MEKLELTKLRRRIFKHFKTKAMNLEGGQSSQMKRYQKDQKFYASRPFTASTFENLQKAVLNSKVIFLGDFHTFEQNTRSVLRIIRFLQKQNYPLVLALEMVEADHQIYIDAYLDGHITELEFLDSINYHQSWRFPWNHYKLIFDLAKDQEIEIKGINCKGTLKQRDQFATEKLIELHQEYPMAKIITLYGELHITPNKLPSMIKQKQSKLKSLIIHQNLDEVYWHMVDTGNGITDIICFNETEFCINAAPPWVKYESMVYWYENLCNDPEFDIHEYLIENGKKIFGDDAHDNFLTLALDMVKLCELDLDQDNLSDFNLYDHTGLEYIEEIIDDLTGSSLRTYYQQIMSIGQSFKIANTNYFYCSSYSLNRISYLAGLQVFHLKYVKNLRDENKILRSNDKEKKLIFLIYQHLCGYFFSKLINPYRKCDMYQDLKNKYAQATNSKQKIEYKGSMSVLDGSFNEDHLKKLNLKGLHKVSLNVGHILGEYFYQITCSNGSTPEHINELFVYDSSRLDYLKLRKTLLEGKDYRGHVKRFF